MTGTSIELDMLHLPTVYRKLAHNQVWIVLDSVRKTAREDALRWIDWSIRGGGTGSKIMRTTKPRALGPKRPPVYGPKRPKGMERGKSPRTRKGKEETKSKRNAPSAPPYRPPIDRGDYANSFGAADIPNGAVVRSSARPQIKVGVIEKGRRAAPIPRRVLEDWVKRKLHVRNQAEAAGIAIAISKKAAKTPRPGLHVIGRARPQIVLAVQKNVLLALRAHRGA